LAIYSYYAKSGPMGSATGDLEAGDEIEIRSWFHILGGNGGSDAQKADNSGTGLVLWEHAMLRLEIVVGSFFTRPMRQECIKNSNQQQALAYRYE
jgi:hypothetical protein